VLPSRADPFGKAELHEWVLPGQNRMPEGEAQRFASDSAVYQVTGTCEILRVKLNGQAEVAGLLGFADASAAISSFAGAIARATDGTRALSLEAERYATKEKARYPNQYRFSTWVIF
jgi:hypothetical protein